MSAKTETRRFTSIVAGLSFLLLAVTGILMFLHVKSRSIADLHQWVGILFLAAVVVHLVINWRVFASYLSHRAFVAGVVCVLVICALVLSFPSEGGRGNARGLHSGYRTAVYR